MNLNVNWAQCYNEEGCENVEWNSYPENFKYPGYPNCTITVMVYYRICNGKTQILIKSIGFYDITNLNGGCNELIKWLWPNDEWEYGVQPNADKLKSLNDYAYQEVILKKMETFIASEGKELFDCETGLFRESSTYTRYYGFCQSYCMSVLESISSPNEDTRIYFSAKNCTPVCCKEITRFCWDSINNELRKDIQTIAGDFPFECQEILWPPCEAVVIPGYQLKFPPTSSSCFPNCKQ